MQNEIKPAFFASANAAEGFVSFFADCFFDACIQRTYLIKGGPGTGKSRFLGDVARAATECGWRVEYYYCSSDPSSLDGVRLMHPTGACIALADATPPHALEPVLPGVRDILVNLGDFWDREKLAKDAGRIRTLSGYRQACFSQGYEYLCAAGKMLIVRDSLIESCISSQRLHRLAVRLSRQIPAGHTYEERIGLCDSIGMKGRVHFDTYESMADKMVVLAPFYGVEYRLMDALCALAREKGSRVYRAPHVLFPNQTATLYFPQNRLCVCVQTPTIRAGQEVQRVDLRHVCCGDALRGVRGEARLAQKLAQSALDAAHARFARAGEYHFELESLYTGAMDFAAKERFTHTFCNAILQNP